MSRSHREIVPWRLPRPARGRTVVRVTAEQLRILVADDSDAFRAGLAALLGSVDGVTLAGEATNGEEAISRALDLHPDVVLMDLHMPGRNGIEATREIVSAAPHIAVLVLTMHEDDESVFAAVQAGARGYLVKGARQGELLRGGARRRRGRRRVRARGRAPDGRLLQRRRPASPRPRSRS